MKTIKLPLSKSLYKKLILSSKKNYRDVRQEILFFIDQALSCEPGENTKTLNIVLEKKG